MMLKVNDIYKSYNGSGVVTPVLRGVSLEVGRGEFVCLLGRSGSGKSTLLNIMSSLLDADKGDIVYMEKPFRGMKRCETDRFRREEAAMIFQFHHLMPYMTAFENVMLPFLSGIRPAGKEQKASAYEALAKVGLEGKEKRLPSQLSGGEQQRVAIARAIVGKPAILFADEPTGSLDKANGDAVMRILSGLNKEGLTVVMVTHQRDYAEYAHKVVELSDGNVDKITVKSA
ncbi:ABC transporter ATP-binding protein [Geovibrio thiophilus]|uniref:ABC transporter ATP-binding protein n=1 Tax=Geovibrio thiophilus TaxID=139438 RepID=A0A410JWE0_9BACT|nr:ABC transporter ATP-binding protein [Geovibrio thiophilus]QAR32484.1 ABC transporter ATP-binding protein [Geovibrio thiophilus]